MPITKRIRKILAGILSVCMVVAMANMSTTVTKAAASNYSLDLGTAIWDDESHTTFKYPHAKIENVSDKLTLVTVTVENGSFTKPADQPEPNLTDINGTSATWIFSGGKTADEVQTFIRNIVFTPQTGSNMNVNITIDGNETRGFNSLPPNSKLTQWTNEHYYLYIPETTSWTKAYNEALNYTLAGRQGYLTTLTDISEIKYLINLNSNACWAAGTRLLKADGSRIDGKKINPVSPGTLKYNDGNNHVSNTAVSRTHYYWACGPEQGQTIDVNLWAPSEPNEAEKTASEGYIDQTLSDIQSHETCIMTIVKSYNLNDIREGNRNDTLKTPGFFIEFGGYEEASLADPGGRDTSKTAIDFKTSVTPVDPEATINGKKYPTVTDALNAAQDGDRITIVKDQVTVANDATLKQGVTLEDRTGQTFKSTGMDSTIDVAKDGRLTLKVGKVDTSANASLSVEEKGTAYDVTVPDSSSTVVAGENNESYVMSENDGTVKIGDISYTYENPDDQHSSMIYIPNGMYQNENVTKAAVAAGKTGTVEVDDNQTVKVTDATNATEEVTVERKNGTVEATVPANATIDAFGRTGITSTAGSLTVKPGKDGGRTTVKVKGTTSFTADGHTYTGLKEGDVIPLGTYTVILNIGDNITPTKNQTDYFYNDQCEVTLTPNQDYDLDKDDVKVTRGGKTVADAAKQEDANVKVSLKVTDNIEINADSKRQKTVITFDIENGKYKGEYSVKDKDDKNVEVKDNKVTVNRNEDITVTFTPETTKTRTVGDSFAILTKLSLDGTSKFNAATFDWDTKGYTYTFKTSQAEQEIKATYTDSHILNVNVTGGTVTGLDKYVGAITNIESVKSVIVPDGESIDLQFSKTDASANHAKLTVNDTKVKKFDGTSYTVTVDERKDVVVKYSQQPGVTVSVDKGTLDTDASDEVWTPEVDGWKTSVEKDGSIKLVFNADNGCGVGSLTINGVVISPEKVTKNADGKYEYTLENVDRETSVKLVFAKEYKVTFKDQNDIEVGSDTVVENHTISKKEFANAKDKLKADEGYTFFCWKDENGKVYTEKTPVTGNTVLKAYFKKGVDNGTTEDNQTGLKAVIGANGFTIHVDNVKNLTSDTVKDRAEVEAIGKDGSAIAKANIKVTGLAELKKATKAGTYELTFEAEDAKVTVEVKVQDMTPAVTGKTAYTVTIKGEPNTEYTVKNPNGTPALDKNGQPIKGTTDANGKVTFVGLEKGKDYVISSEESGSVKTGTSAVDAEDIANSFRENEKDKAKVTGEGLNEKAENSKVDVVVDENGNYKVILKDDINGTVKVPDTWGDITVDLNGNTIKGNDATDKEPAKPGLDFVKDDTSKGNGTNLVIKDTSKDGTGTIAGGNGSSRYPDGAAGIKGDKDASTPTVEVEKPVKVIGGNGATGENGNGGNGGSGIEGNIDTIINGGTVIGGNGGNGADNDKGNGGTGGNGGNGIDSDNKNVTVKDGEVTGGNAGNGGSSENGNGGNGGTGGNGITGSKDNEISGGEINGGNGGDGGNSDKGNGGNGGNGGDGVDNGKNPGTITGGDINGGNGGNGGNTNDGTGGSGGNGGNGIDGTGNTIDENVKPDGGNGGNGGSSTNGQGGQSGARGNGTSDGKVPGTGHDGKEGQSGQNSTDNSSKPQVKPSTTVKTNKDVRQGKIKTGDESKTMVYGEIAALSFVGLMILFLTRKREELKER